jgi:hypothetical protein
MPARISCAEIHSEARRIAKREIDMRVLKFDRLCQMRLDCNVWMDMLTSRLMILRKWRSVIA